MQNEVEHVIYSRGERTYATMTADLKSTTGSTMFPNSSLYLSILKVARIDAIVIHNVDIAIWAPGHFLEWCLIIGVRNTES